MGQRQRWRRLAPETRREIIRMRAAGRTYRDILAELDVSMGTITTVMRPLGGVVRREGWNPTGVRLSLDERVEIKLGVERGLSLRAIAGGLGRDPATVCRELNRHGGRTRYAPMAAHRAAEVAARRPKQTKLAASPALRAQVVTGLERLWSPCQIARRLRVDFGDDASMRLSHETIYKSLYVQGRGELRRELAACLRTGRAQRRPHGRLESRGKNPDMVMISARPAEAADRAIPGHWEGDLIIGANGASAVGTLVERSTRFVMLLHLPRDRTAVAVREAMTAKVATLPAALKRSITWDQGKEMAEHLRFSVETGIPVYFCDPRSPWQRGTNENTNGLLRQYMPKGTSLRRFSETDLDAIADSLNSRPRQTLNWMTPSERLAELVAPTG